VYGALSLLAGQESCQSLRRAPPTPGAASRHHSSSSTRLRRGASLPCFGRTERASRGVQLAHRTCSNECSNSNRREKNAGRRESISVSSASCVSRVPCEPWRPPASLTASAAGPTATLPTQTGARATAARRRRSANLPQPHLRVRAQWSRLSGCDVAGSKEPSHACSPNVGPFHAPPSAAPCKFDFACTRADCYFLHPSGPLGRPLHAQVLLSPPRCRALISRTPGRAIDAANARYATPPPFVGACRLGFGAALGPSASACTFVLSRPVFLPLRRRRRH